MKFYSIFVNTIDYNFRYYQLFHLRALYISFAVQLGLNFFVDKDSNTDSKFNLPGFSFMT